LGWPNKRIDIIVLDNNRLPVVLKFENYQWIFLDDSATGTPVRTDKIVERNNDVDLEEIDISLKCTHLKWHTKFLRRLGLGQPWNEKL
jgi:hypothetical protein